MRWLVWSFRSAFCKHQWEYQDQEMNYDSGLTKKYGIKVSATCKKCGWHRKYWKH